MGDLAGAAHIRRLGLMREGVISGDKEVKLAEFVFQECPIYCHSYGLRNMLQVYFGSEKEMRSLFQQCGLEKPS